MLCRQLAFIESINTTSLMPASLRAKVADANLPFAVQAGSSQRHSSQNTPLHSTQYQTAMMCEHGSLSYLLYAVQAAVVGLICEHQQAARHRQQ
jgi:hypothetical protein